jgi:hypothetical protein
MPGRLQPARADVAGEQAVEDQQGAQGAAPIGEEAVIYGAYLTRSRPGVNVTSSQGAASRRQPRAAAQRTPT